MKAFIDRTPTSQRLDLYFAVETVAGVALARPDQPIVFDAPQPNDVAQFKKGPTWALPPSDVIALYTSLGAELRRLGLLPAEPSVDRVAGLERLIEEKSRMISGLMDVARASAERPVNVHLAAPTK